MEIIDERRLLDRLRDLEDRVAQVERRANEALDEVDRLENRVWELENR